MWLRRGDIGIRFGSAWSGTGALPASLEKGARALGLRSEEVWLPRRRTCSRGTVAFSGHAPGTGVSNRRSEDSRFAYISSRELYSNLVYGGFEYNSYFLMSRRSCDLANAETESAKNF